MSVESEQQVIGAILLEPSVFHDVSRALTSDHFASVHHRSAYRAICELFSEGVQPDEIKLATKLGGGVPTSESVAYVTAVAERAVTPVGVVDHAHAVIAEAKKRALVRACAEVTAEAKTAVFYSKAEAEAWFAEMARKLDISAVIESSNLVTAHEAVKETLHVAKTRYELRGQLPGMRTGFTKLDEYLLGLQRGHLVLLAGKPAAGKTALGLNMALNVAKENHVALVCSHEMNTAELMMRILSNDSRVPGVQIETGQLNADYYARLEPSSARVSKLPIFFASNPPKTIPALMAECHQLKRKNGLDLVVVDYLQLMDSAEPRGKSREQSVSEVSRGLKRIAMDLGVCVLAMSQLNRQTDRNSEPALSELRESGALEQDANSVVMIWAEKDDAPIVLGKVAKNRSGQVGPFQLAFRRTIQRFENTGPEFPG